MLRRWMHFMLDCVFPRFCVNCRRVEGTFFCRRCFIRIQTMETQVCAQCTRAHTELGTRCLRCLSGTADTPLDGLMTATPATHGVVRHAIHLFKYRFIVELDRVLSGLMLRALLREIGTNDLVIIPVPLHPKRLRWRGFNQAALLARMIGSSTDIPVVSDLLVRRRHTTSQATLHRTERVKNIARAFSCRHTLHPRTDVLLIDDVATTGATLTACARVLKENGARRVYGLVVSRGT